MGRVHRRKRQWVELVSDKELRKMKRMTWVWNLGPWKNSSAWANTEIPGQGASLVLQSRPREQFSSTNVYGNIPSLTFVWTIHC